MSETSSHVAFTAAVQVEQANRGSRNSYARMDEKGTWTRTVTEDLAAFIGQQDFFYLATASADGNPYIQHRGGAPGFLKVLDETTLAFADFAGNKQYITLGNLAENDRAFIFLMDYANRQRIKLWGRAEAVDDNRELLANLTDTDYLSSARARPERAIVFHLEQWDVNCPQHITPRYSAQQAALVVEELNEKIAVLEAELMDLRANLAHARAKTGAIGEPQADGG